MELVADEANESVAVIPITLEDGQQITSHHITSHHITSHHVILNESSRTQSDGGGKSKHTQRS